MKAWASRFGPEIRLHLEKPAFEAEEIQLIPASEKLVTMADLAGYIMADIHKAVVSQEQPAPAPAYDGRNEQRDASYKMGCIEALEAAIAKLEQERDETTASLRRVVKERDAFENNLHSLRVRAEKAEKTLNNASSIDPMAPWMAHLSDLEKSRDEMRARAEKAEALARDREDKTRLLDTAIVMVRADERAAVLRELAPALRYTMYAAGLAAFQPRQDGRAAGVVEVVEAWSDDVRTAARS